MMRIRMLPVMLIFILAVGCRPQTVESQTPPAEQAQQRESNLPPPGRQVVGSRPPMPQPVVRETLENFRIETIASGLVVPWDMAVAPDGRIYITERPGRVRLIANNRLRAEPYATIENVAAIDEGGLMGIALHPDYPNPRWVYLMYTYRADGNIYNRISRFTDTGALTDERPVVTRIPGNSFHDGGIIRFGPDGMLYAGTGDAGRAELAQDRGSLAGKILRVNPEGGVPSDNPFSGSLVYAYGFRNVQGLAWNPANNDLWAVNHGPTANDSVFIVQRGGNHGWPRVQGVTNVRGVVDPIMFFPEYSIAPSRAMFYTGSLIPNLRGNFLFTTLRGQHLQRVMLSGPRQISRIERWWQTGRQQGRYGRLRVLAQGRDGALYVGASNRSRGNPRSGDDRILRITPR